MDPSTATEPLSASVAIDGYRMRRLRQRAGDSLASFGAKARISPSYVSQIERGTSPTVSPPVFRRICDALGMDDPEELRCDIARPVAA